MLPKAVVSAIVIVAITRLIDFDEFFVLVRRNETRKCAVYAVTFFGTLFQGVDFGLAFGVFVDMLPLMRDALRKRLVRAMRSTAI